MMIRGQYGKGTKHKPTKVNHKLPSEVILKACPMINSTLLDVREDIKRKLEPRSDLEEARVYGHNDERANHIGAYLTAMDKY